MRVRTSSGAVLAGALAGTLLLPAPGAQAAPTTFGNVVAPVLATDTSGNKLAVAQRDRDGTAARGQVVARFRAAGTSGSAWTRWQPVSAPGRTGSVVDADMGSAGMAVVVWTQGTGSQRAAYTRTRHPSGKWGPATRISPFGAGEHVAVDVNGRRDTAITYTYANRPRLVTRAWGSGWRTAVASLPLHQRSVDAGDHDVQVAPRPDVSLQGRLATVAWVAGSGQDTAVHRLSRKVHTGAPYQRRMWAEPGITGFDFAPGTGAGPVLALVRRNAGDPGECAAGFPAPGELVTVHWGPGGRKVMRADNAFWQTDPVASTAGRQARVSWMGGFLTGNCLDYVMTISTQRYAAGKWSSTDLGGEIRDPNAVPVLRQALAADGAGLLSVSMPWGKATSYRVYRFVAGQLRIVKRVASAAAPGEGAPPAAVTIGPRQWSTAGWTQGPAGTRNPTVKLQSFAR
jgi:hypothetical protein